MITDTAMDYGELAVELSGYARQETYRHEYGAKHERHCYECSAEIAHRLLGGLIRRQMFLVHYTVDILDHDDGVVDHNTDRQDKSQQREHVEREAEHEHDAERTYERYGDGDYGNERRPPALQREEDDQYHQQQGFEQRTVDVVYRLRDVGGHVERDLVGDSFGESGADLLHRFAHRFGDLHGIGARQHVDVEHGGVASVYTALGAVR